MNRDDLKNVARQALYAHAPELTTELATRIINAGHFQRWLDRVERERPRGIVAWVRRLRGKDRGITPEQQREVSEIARKVLEKFGR